MKKGLRLIKNTSFQMVLLCNLTLFLACAQQSTKKTSVKSNAIEQNIEAPSIMNVVTGAEQVSSYLPLLKGKNIGIVANQTSVIFSKNSTIHLVDSLLNNKLNIKKVFAPEHGFRGKADAGEIIKDGKDVKTGLPILSLYGKNKKPSKEQLAGIDMMIFDIQDVGARFYTYISTLHYIMEACAENNIPVLILDRPNPNGHYTDGPILETEHKSFVGMHPIPIVHGMTIGEYAQMINGEQWLKNGIQCELKVVSCLNYTHNSTYELPIKPSPNLPNAKSINLYPSLCFFEGTNISVGRGTDKQFQIIGYPGADKKQFSFNFTPESNEGAKNPKHKGKICYGYDLTTSEKLDHLNLSWLIEFYRESEAPESFFKPFFTKLAGTKKLQEQITNGVSEEEIRLSWKKDLEAYNTMRQKYLLYK